MTLDPVPDLIERFRREHFVLNSITEDRQAFVLAVLHRYTRDIGKALMEADDNDLRAWLAALMEADLRASSVGTYLKAVRSFYEWAWRAHLLDAEALLRFRAIKPPRGANTALPRPYNRKELAALWAALDDRFPHTTPLVLQRWRNGTSPWRSVRKHAMRLQLDAMIELALVCGLRRGEIYRLSIDDVHWDNKYIVVHGKRTDQNPKVREVPYPDSTRRAIRAWVRMRALIGPDPGQPIWLSVTGPEPSAGMTFLRLERLFRPLGHWELHRLRHTCATERLRAGMPIEQLRDFLGHTHIAMTLRYAKLVSGDIHKTAERTDAEFQRAIRAA